MVSASSLLTENNSYPQGITRFLIVVTVMLVAIMEVLDMTIVNVAISPMMGALGANTEQITWVLTSYIVSAAIFMIMTGFLVSLLGRRKLLLINILGFTFASVCCGLSTSLTQIIFTRTLQGIFGASLVPLSQIILRSIYPQEDHGKAMAIWGVGVMLSPALGPTLGGIIIEHLNWRWIFLVNLPFGIIAYLMTLYYIADSPKQKVTWDAKGLLLLIIGVGALQLFLDRGNNNDWFNSISVILSAWMALMALGLFIHHALYTNNPVVHIRLLTNFNFKIGCFLAVNFTAGSMSLLALIPLMLEHILSYSAEITGWVMAPLGLASAAGMFSFAVLGKRLDPRLFMTGGILLASAACHLFSHYNTLTDTSHWSLAALILGCGIGWFFVPLSTLTFRTLLPDQVAQASGLFSFARNLGTSIGISILTTIITRENQINWNSLQTHLYQGSFAFQWWLQRSGWNAQDPLAIQHLAASLANQAGMVAFIDCFHLVSIWLLLLLPFVWILDSSAVP